MKYIDVYREAVTALKDAGIPEAETDARLLLEYVCNTDRNTLYAHPDRDVETGEYEEFLKLLNKRKDRIPLQHLTGVQEFMGLEFKVTPDVLIPRQDTEILVEEALKTISDGERILDLCTGSGCILTSLLFYSNGCEGVGADISEAALKVAKDNADRLLKDKEETSYSFLQSDLYEAVEGTFDLVVSNPPYIPTDVIEGLMPEVAKHEPYIALDGKNDGLWFYDRIVERINDFLKPGGRVMFEIGHDQGEAVSSMLKAKGYKEVEVVKDYAGLDRTVKGYRPIV